MEMVIRLTRSRQGHNIKLLTLVSIFFLPLTFVTSVFGMTNMPTERHYWMFGIVWSLALRAVKRIIVLIIVLGDGMRLCPLLRLDWVTEHDQRHALLAREDASGRREGPELRHLGSSRRQVQVGRRG
jgi:hypothetical protein